MARLIVAIVIVGILILGAVLLVRTVRTAVAEADQGKRMDMAQDGMLPKLAYGLLLALIVYATLTAGG